MQESTNVEYYPDNPLVHEVLRVLARLDAFREEVRAFYYEVILSCHACTECGGRLRMIADSRCACDAGHELDPTVAFQRSECCNARVTRRVLHYECSTCRRTVPSRYLFEERLFDAAYFKTMMRDSRARAREQREAVRLLLLDSRSPPLLLSELPEFHEIPGLGEALDAFVGAVPALPASDFTGLDVFDLDAYRRVLLEALGDYSMWFDAFPKICKDARLDRVRRFATLVYLEQEGRVDLAQHGERIAVVRHEADLEG
jgi:hypothetical protein